MIVTEPTTPLIFHAQPGGAFFIYGVFYVSISKTNGFESTIGGSVTNTRRATCFAGFIDF